MCQVVKNLLIILVYLLYATAVKNVNDKNTALRLNQ